jgi:predicted glycosyltransferase
LRDILDSPEVTANVWRRNRYHEAVQNYYDQVLVLGSPTVFDVNREYEFPPGTRAKVRYCGYVARPPGRGFREKLRAEMGVAADEKLVLVTVGGGEDGDRVLSCYVEGWHADAELKAAKVRTLLVCGSEMNETNRRHVINGAGDSRLIVREFSDDMMALMDAADLVVCMGGYNTTCELLTLRKRAVMVPRARPVEEQWIRAERLAAMGLFHAIHPDHLQPSMLMQAVKDELAKIDSGVPAPSAAIDLRGLSRMFEAITELTADLGSLSGSYPRPALVLG